MSKRRYSDVEEKYADKYMGPEQFLEAGTRGFLLTTLPEKEEFGIDIAKDLLRQAAIKLHGGIKAKKNLERDELDKGYVKVDFMDPKDVIFIPNPDGDDIEEEDKEEKKEKDKDIEKQEVDGEEKAKDEATKEDAMEDLKDQETNEEVSMDTQECESVKEKESEDKDKDGKHSKKKAKKEEKSEGKGNKEKTVKKDEKKKEKKPEKTEKVFVYFKTTYKFKAFRTEIRNLMFITSDYPDPIELCMTAMDIVLSRKFIPGDPVQQLVPVLGVSEFDLFQLEVMSRRVLSPLFDENLPPKFTSVMLFDKLSEPGSLMLTEIVRNAIWSINPLTTLSSALTEPDIVIRLEVIGSKLVLCCMPKFITYRQYSPCLLVKLGLGEAEDDDLTHLSHDMRQEILKERAIKRQEEEELKQRQELKKQRREEDMKRKAAAEARKEAAKKTAEEQRKKREEEKKKKAAEKTKKAEAEKLEGEAGKEDSVKMETCDSSNVKEEEKEKVTDEVKVEEEEKLKSEEEENSSEVKDEVELKPEEEPAKAAAEETAETEEPPSKTPRSRRSTTRKTKK